MTTLRGFSVSQPFCGATLEFFPAMGTQELDDLISAYVPGPASIQEKRATVTIEFLQHSNLTGDFVKFFPVLMSPTASFVDSPGASGTLQDSGYASAFSLSPSWSDWNSPASSTAPATPPLAGRPRKAPHKPAKPAARNADFSDMPGMKILTKDGQDVTNSASRGCKTREQRDHAHLMRIMKACDSCRRKKTRCDPSHRQQASQSSSRPLSKSSASKSHGRPAPTTASPRSMALDLPTLYSAPPSVFKPLPSAPDDNPPAPQIGDAGDFGSDFLQGSLVSDLLEDYDICADPLGFFSEPTSSVHYEIPSAHCQPQSAGNFPDHAATTNAARILSPVSPLAAGFELGPPSPTSSEDCAAARLERSRLAEPAERPQLPSSPGRNRPRPSTGVGLSSGAGLPAISHAPGPAAPQYSDFILFSPPAQSGSSLSPSPRHSPGFESPLQGAFEPLDMIQHLPSWCYLTRETRRAGIAVSRSGNQDLFRHQDGDGYRSDDAGVDPPSSGRADRPGEKQVSPLRSKGHSSSWKRSISYSELPGASQTRGKQQTATVDSKLSALGSGCTDKWDSLAHDTIFQVALAMLLLCYLAFGLNLQVGVVLGRLGLALPCLAPLSVSGESTEKECVSGGLVRLRGVWGRISTV